MLIADKYRLPLKVKGDSIGVEIEVEGHNLMPPRDLHYWRIDRDGSLRGESCEYIFAAPLNIGKVQDAIDELLKAHKDVGTVINDSDRCGVHVHINMQDMTIQQCINIALLYFIFEEVLVRYCGEDREGNLFCLRARDAEYLISTFRKCYVGKTLHYLLNENFRYASLNIYAIQKYGTFEFRAFRTPTNLNDIVPWVNILSKLKKYGKGIENPRDIVERMSAIGPRAFLAEVFEDTHKELIVPDLDQLMYRGVRLIQDIVYIDHETIEKHKRAVIFTKEAMNRLWVGLRRPYGVVEVENSHIEIPNFLNEEHTSVIIDGVEFNDIDLMQIYAEIADKLRLERARGLVRRPPRRVRPGDEIQVYVNAPVGIQEAPPIEIREDDEQEEDDDEF